MTTPNTILALDVHGTRIAYAVVFRRKPVDWGVTRLRRPGLQSAKHLQKLLGELCRLWQPAVSVIRGSRGGHTGLIRRALAGAGVRSLFDQARHQASRQRNGPTKHQLACDLARQFPGLNHLLPRKRRLWDPEDDRMHIFTAIRLALLSPRAGKANP
jgi:hypothetical protein